MSCNSIYSIHETFYSSSLSSVISSLFLSLVLILSLVFGNLFLFNMQLFSLILFLVLWINDYCIENSFSFTRTEQFSLVYGIKIMILSEFLLFFACFWSLINFRLILNAWCLFFCFPLLSSNSFAIPYTNVILLLFSSLPIQSASIFYKIGLFNFCIEQISQTISCGITFLLLQIKEFLYSYLSISDSMIGSIFYFTTGLHGAHVFFGLLSFWLILMLILFSISLSLCFYFIYFYSFFPFIYLFIYSFIYLFIYLFINSYSLWCFLFNNELSFSISDRCFIFLQYASLYYIEFNTSMFFSVYYWHFVDVIWFFVFFMYFIHSFIYLFFYFMVSLF